MHERDLEVDLSSVEAGLSVELRRLSLLLAEVVGAVFRHRKSRSAINTITVVHVNAENGRK